MTAHRDPDIQPAPDRAAETLSAMRPADVPAHLYRRALDAVLSLDDDGPRAVTVQQEVAAALAAVLPEHERQVREQVAAEIRAVALDRDLTREDRYETTGECSPYWRDVWRTDGLWGALLIARGCHTCSCEETRECLRESTPGADPEGEAQ